jgi:hypothetical protein
VRLPLSVFKFTAAAVDKILYFGGQQLQLDIYFEAGTKWAFTNTTTTNRPDLTPAAITTAALGTSAISNIALYVYLEQNPDICSSLIDQVRREGMKLTIPYVFTYKTNLASGAQTITQNITKAQGERVLFVAWAGYNNAESSSTAKDHNVYPLLSTSYQTTLNSVPIVTNSLINVGNGDAWLYNRDSISGSAVSNMFSYYQQFVHFDNFAGMSISDLHKNLTTKGGIPCTSQTQQYGLSVTNAGSQLNYYVFFVTQKTLTIRDNEVLVSVESDL